MPRRAWHAIWLTLACSSLALLGGAGVSRAEPAEECTTSGPLVCVSVLATPQTVSPSRVGSPTYVSYDVLVSNEGTSTLAHVALDVTLPAGASLVSATPSAGSCEPVAGGVSCELGSIAGRTGAGAAIVAEAPRVEGSAIAVFAASFDERSNDGPAEDPKQDSVSVSEAVAVAATTDSAASFVPEGASVEISTDPTGAGVTNSGDALIASAAITSSPRSLTAELDEVPGPLACPQRVVCRRGDWVEATIPGTFDPPLAFSLRWDATLIPSGLTGKKFAVLLTDCLDGCPLEVVSDSCSSATPAASELPCLVDVKRLRDGDWVATLLKSHNGYMR